jgi:TRAP transporter TAXI family solute receptor
MKFRISMLMALGLLLGSTAGAENVGIATGTPGSIYHSLGTALAKVANEKAGIVATIQPFASATVFTPGVNSGELPLGFGNVYETSLAYEGKEFFSGRPNQDLRAVAITHPMRNTLFVRKNSPFHKISDLKGHPAPDGYSSQKILIPIIDAIYATAGLTRGDFKPIYVPNVVAGADALATGKADVFFFAVGGAKIREVDASVNGLRALNIENTPQSLAAIRKHFPTAYLRLEKPGPDNAGITEPVWCLTYDGLLFASTKTPEDLVYKITKVLYESKPELIQSFALYKEFEPKDMAKNIPVPYHPGAIKFYKEKGMWPPK